jgi:hypothetical protein
MEFRKATCQYLRLANGSHTIEIHGQWGDYCIKLSFLWLPQNNSPFFSRNMFHRCMAIHRKHVVESGVSISYLSDPSEPPYYNTSAPPYFNTTSPTTMPQLRLVSNSSTLTPCGFLEFSIRSFGIEPSQSIRTFMPTLSKIPGNNFCSLFREQGEHIPYSLVVDIYDLHAT